MKVRLSPFIAFVALGACAQDYGDAPAPAADAGAGAEASTDGGPAPPLADGSTPAPPGQPIPLDVAVNQFATCATVRYGSAPTSFCWGGASPNIREYVGASAADPTVGGFTVPRLKGASLVFDKLFGTGTGSWFVASGTAVQGTPLALSWGSNLFGQSGQGALVTTQNVLPGPLKTTEGRTLIPSTAGGGARHGCIIEDSKLYCWGQNDTCQVAAGTAPTCSAGEAAPVLGPQATAAIAGQPGQALYDRVAVGESHTCVVAHEAGALASVYCFGSNTSMQCGVPLPLAIAAAQKPTGLGTTLAQQIELAAGDRHTCAIIKNKLYCWGANGGRQADPTGTNDAVPPTAIGALPGELSQLTLAGEATCAVLTPPGEKSRAICFGRGELGREGATPGVSAVAGIEDVKRLAMSNTHGCAIASATGSSEVGLYCWGSNVAKAVDPNATADRFPTPHRVLFPAD